MPIKIKNALKKKSNCCQTNGWATFERYVDWE